MGHNGSLGRSNQVLVIIIAGLLLLLIVFGLSKLIPRNPLPTLRPSPSPQTLSSPSVSNNTYTNDQYGFTITLPQGWEARPNPAPAPHRLLFVDFAPASTSSLASIEIKDQSVDDAIIDFRTQVNQSSTRRIILEREVRLDKQYIKQINVHDQTSNTDTFFRFAPKTNRTYVLSAQDSKLLDSFSFILPTPQPTP
ncbi:MAG: hypothetical protein HY381_01345 [Candidatus Chisholmbacteria bacterium]|nr:hypothetical protein [Candidatus Chisholmbacteria bacterium]